MSDRSVVVANAGSGKTYLLANRYVRWMLEARSRGEPSSPERILAITFTRKAAGEIIERVLQHLAQGASSAERRAEFAKEGQVGDFGAHEYAAVLEDFVVALHRVSISTIDGFFVQLAGAFAAELGMPEEWQVGDEDVLADQRLQAVGDVIAHDPARAAELARRIGDGAPKVQVGSAIDSVLDDALDLWARASLHGDPRVPWEALLGEGTRIFPSARRATRDQLDSAASALAAAPLPAKFEAKWRDAVARVRQLAAAGDWIGFLKDGLVAGLQSGGTFCGQEPTQELEDALAVLRSHACAEAEHAIRERIRATADLADLVTEALAAARRRSGTYGFGDVTFMLAHAEVLGGEGIQRMHERLDRSIRDLAFDEFQDTAPAQWSVVQPLVDEIAAHGDRRMLVVGDPKQSIYAWRGGTPALLGAVQRLGRLDRDHPLDTSFRSSPVVLSFVNELFGPLESRVGAEPLDAPPAGAVQALRDAGLPASAEAGRSPLLRALRAWPFTEHRPAERNLGMAGAVHAYVAADAGSAGQAEAVAEVVAARVQERPGATVGVLLSRNSEVADCVAAIRALGIDVSDEGRSPLVDSAAVAAVLALLRLAEDRNDRLAHWIATREPACALLGLVPMERHGGGEALESAARDLSARVRAEVLELGLAAWVERHAALLRPACSRNDLDRLRQLAALAHAAAPEMSACPDDFVRSVESRRSRTGEEARVRVMTVHASKGLEFDEVILGSMGRTMGETEAGIGEWSALVPDPLSGPVAIAPVAAEHFCDFSPLLRAFRAEASVARLSDDLSALYVGVTRAREALHLVCPPRAKADKEKVTPAWLLRRSFADFDQAVRGDRPGGQGKAWRAWTFVPEGGAPPAGLPPRPLPAAAGSPRPETPEVQFAPRPTAVRAPSAHDAADGRFFAREFAGDDDGARGSLAHAWLERIEWIDEETGGRAGEGAPAGEAVAGGAAAGRVSAERATSGHVLEAIDAREVVAAASIDVGRPIPAELEAEVRGAVAQALAGPMSAVLRRTRCDAWACDGLEVRVEMPFAVATDDGLVRGRMDRVVLGVRDGRVEHAEIVDWKTGARGLAGEALEERIAPYRRQMAAYRAAICTMFALPADRVGAVLAMVDRGELIEA